MDKPEVKQMADFLIEVREGLCESDWDAAMRLMDATFVVQDQGFQSLLVSLEYEARLRKQEIEGRLGVRN